MTTPTDINAMTPDKRRNWLANDDGYVYGKSSTCYYAHWNDAAGWPCLDDDGHDSHPIQNTLDAAHAAMPEGWTWLREYGQSVKSRGIEWYANNAPGMLYVSIEDTGNPRDDLFHLACLARLAMKEKA